MRGDYFLENREQFAFEVGRPDLYDYVDHFGLYAGTHTLGNKLFTYEMMKSTVGVPGHIVEFGCWNGSNLMFLAKLNTLFEPHAPKKIIGFDNFNGLPKSSSLDGNYADTQLGNYRGDAAILSKVISLFQMEKKVTLVVGDARKTIPKFHKDHQETLISFAYLDFDLYEPTMSALELIEDCICVGGVIVFDEACTEEWPGETRALKEFLQTTEHEFQVLSNQLSRQPTVALKRTK